MTATPPTTTIRTRPLGNSGIDVTEIGIGLWAQGGGWGPLDDQNALNAIDAALERGVNFYDTADVYGMGHSEELLAKAMAGRRDKFIVATKIGWIDFDGDNFRSQYDTPDKIVAGVEDSLRRLKTDHVELIQCHIDQPEPNTHAFIEGFRKLKRDGKVRAFGLSTSNLEHLKAFNADGDCDTLQIDYSILNRTPEADTLPYCMEHSIGVIVRGPLAMGILTGKLDANSSFPDGDFRQAWTTDPAQHQAFLADLDTVERLRALLSEGETMARLALQFVLAHPAVTTVIPGARNPSQAIENTKAGAMGALGEDACRAIEAIVPPGGGRKIWPA